LSEPEQRVYTALQVEGQLSRHEREGWTRQRLVRHLLQTMPEHENLRYTFASQLNTRSISLRKEGRLEAAIASYRKALKTHPDDDHLHFNLARAYYEKGETAACLEMLEKALAINPDLAEARRFQAYLRQGGD
jgi:tetratricopeptide (TPR) repeat protein